MPTFRGYSGRKDFVLMNKLFPFRVSHFQKGGNYFQIRVISLEVYPFTSMFSLLFFIYSIQWYMSYKAIYKYVNNSFRNKIFFPITFSIWNETKVLYNEFRFKQKQLPHWNCFPIVITKYKIFCTKNNKILYFKVRIKLFL